MIYSPYNEFPHEVVIGKREKVGQYPKQREVFIEIDIVNCFMDTPTTNEFLVNYQMGNTFDRNMYTPYEIEVDSNKHLFKFDNKIYECVGESVDQGGMHEVNLTKLKVCNIGTR